MADFNDREKAFENKFARDQEVQFKITARRNPNLAILTVAAVIGRPDVGVNVVAVWVAVCIVVHAVRFAQAGLARRHGPLQSWLR